MFNCLNDFAPQYLQMLLSWNAPLSAINCNVNVNPRKTIDSYLLVIPSDFGKKKTDTTVDVLVNMPPAVGINFHMILEVVY